jgi:transposase
MKLMKRGMSQKQAAKQAGVSAETLRRPSTRHQPKAAAPKYGNDCPGSFPPSSGVC